MFIVYLNLTITLSSYTYVSTEHCYLRFALHKNNRFTTVQTIIIHGDWVSLCLVTLSKLGVGSCELNEILAQNLA